MRRRELLKYAGATALAAPFIRAARADQASIKVGVVGAKTGPLAPGAAATFLPPWQLWAHQVNQAGGLKLKDGPRKVELIEYDDHTQPAEAIKALEAKQASATPEEKIAIKVAVALLEGDSDHSNEGLQVDLASLGRALARASGIGGMVGGQMLDLAGEGRFGDREPVDVARLQQMKTGALLRFGCIAGAILGQSSQQEYEALDDYGRALGEAFQIADDLLDVEGDAAALGKQTGQDAALGKTTFVTQLGIDGAKQRVRDLLARADKALSIFGAKGDVLRAAARFVAERKN